MDVIELELQGQLELHRIETAPAVGYDREPAGATDDDIRLVDLVQTQRERCRAVGPKPGWRLGLDDGSQLTFGQLPLEYEARFLDVIDFDANFHSTARTKVGQITCRDAMRQDDSALGMGPNGWRRSAATASTDWGGARHGVTGRKARHG